MSVRNIRVKAQVKARKRHECSLCTGEIPVGSTYERATNVYDDRIYDWLTCSACLADNIGLLVWNWSFRGEEGISPDTALDWAEETAQFEAAAQRFLDRRLG